jgi:hypothetical protein
MLKLTTVLSAVAIGALAACSSGGAESTKNLDASWAVTYRSLPDLKSNADVVARGKITKVIAQTEVKTVPFTDFEFTVEQSIQDNGHRLSALDKSATAPITLHQTGGTVDNVRFQIEDDPLFQVGEEYVLFLNEYKPGFYKVIGGPTGRFAVKQGIVTPINDEGVTFTGSTDAFVTQLRAS